jgi:hypothetical protein
MCIDSSDRLQKTSSLQSYNITHRFCNNSARIPSRARICSHSPPIICPHSLNPKPPWFCSRPPPGRRDRARPAPSRQPPQLPTPERLRPEQGLFFGPGPALGLSPGAGKSEAASVGPCAVQDAALGVKHAVLGAGAVLRAVGRGQEGDGAALPAAVDGVS